MVFKKTDEEINNDINKIRDLMFQNQENLVTNIIGPVQANGNVNIGNTNVSGLPLETAIKTGEALYVLVLGGKGTDIKGDLNIIITDTVKRCKSTIGQIKDLHTESLYEKKVDDKTINDLNNRLSDAYSNKNRYMAITICIFIWFVILSIAFMMK